MIYVFDIDYQLLLISDINAKFFRATITWKRRKYRIFCFYDALQISK